MADITSTLNLIDSAISSAGDDARSAPTVTSPSIAPKSAADQTIDLLQAGIDGKLPAAAKPYETTAKSIGLNTTAGINDEIATGFGMPVDAATGAVNLGIRGVNAIAGRPIANELGDLPGGKQSIKNAMGLIKANPDNVVPQNEAERIARGAGEGIGGAVMLPLGGEALAASKVISPAAAEATRAALGAPDALNATIGAASGAGSTIAADAVPEPYKPLAATVGGIVGGAPVVAVHGAAEGARAALEGLKNHVTEEGARRAVGKEMAAASTDQAAARENLATQPHEILPGSVGTTGQIAGDTGLLNWERGVRQKNAAEFNNREAEQNSAQTAHLESVQPAGNAADLPGMIAGQREATARTASTNTGVVEALANRSVSNAEGGQKSALEGLQALKPDASPAEVSAHFRDVRDALEARHEAAVGTAERQAETARSGAAPDAQSPEQVGQNIRVPAEAARATAKEAVDKLYAALPKDIEAPSADVAIRAKDIKAGMLPEHAPMEGEEARLFGLAKNYGDQAPLANLNALRSSILSEKANLKRSNPQAYGRLSQLQNTVENAIDHGIESRAALDQVAVRRGTMAAEDALPARLNQRVDDEADRQSAVAARSGRPGAGPGRPEGVDAGGAAGGGDSNSRPGNAAGGEGLSASAGTQASGVDRSGTQSKIDAWDRTRQQALARADEHEFTAKQTDVFLTPEEKQFHEEAAVNDRRSADSIARHIETLKNPIPAEVPKAAPSDPAKPAAPSSPPIQDNPLREANAAYRNVKQTFDEGPVGDITSKNGRGQHDLSPAELTKKVFHPGDTGGEDVRAYVKAVGRDTANTTLSDAAAASLHEKAMRPDGTLDPKKVDNWLSAHKTAIAELPPQTRTRFENAASAQRAVEDAFAARRDALNAYDRSEAGKLMGLKDEGDVVREVGSIIGAKDGAKRMGELAQAARGNPAASDGLQRAVVEHVMNKFLPDGLEKAQAFVKEKADVLAKVFTPEQVDAISSKLEAAQTAGVRLEAAKTNRETSLKQAQASEKEVLSRYDSTILGKIMRTEGAANVLDKLGTVFGSSDSGAQMGLLADEAAKVNGGTDALRKAVTEMIRRDYSGTAEVGTSGEKGLSRAALDKFMKENTETLEKVLSPAQVGKIKAIVADQLRANRSITATKLKGGSDTAQNQIATKGGSILSLIARHAAESGATVAGAILGGPAGAIAGQIGAKAMSALRDAGMNRLNEIRIRAALDPQFGKALLDEVPKYPDRNAAALIALRARQLSVAGVTAGARQ
jgi:hypothetical protein